MAARHFLGTCMTRSRNRCKGGRDVFLNSAFGSHCTAQLQFKLTQYHLHLMKYGFSHTIMVNLSSWMLSDVSQVATAVECQRRRSAKALLGVHNAQQMINIS
jgi:hypothetical protein